MTAGRDDRFHPNRQVGPSRFRQAMGFVAGIAVDALTNSSAGVLVEDAIAPPQRTNPFASAPDPKKRLG